LVILLSTLPSLLGIRSGRHPQRHLLLRKLTFFLAKAREKKEGRVAAVAGCDVLMQYEIK
jgi:hypothetical protein